MSYDGVVTIRQFVLCLDSEERRLRLATSILILLMVVGGLALGCSRTEQKPLPFSIVLITVDTLRSDRVGAYGYAAADTPEIDRFASEGALFENVYCDTPWTTASMASVMTGLFSTEHGLQLPWLRLPDSQLTMAEVFRDHGYKTGAVVGIFSLDSAYGLDQGFDDYDDEFSLPTVVMSDRAPTSHVDLKITDDLSEYAQIATKKQTNDAYKDDEAVTESALNWLEETDGEPFFLWAHYFGPHERIVLTEGAGANRSRMLKDYDRDLAKTDRAIGRLLRGIDDLGGRSNTLVVLSSDHGQTLGERQGLGHGRDVYEPEVRIPLVVRMPSRIDAGVRVQQVVRSIDIFPTFLDYADLEAADGLAGSSVRPLIESGEPDGRAAFMDLGVVMPTLMDDDEGEHFFGSIHFQGIREGNWKLVKAELAPPCWQGGGEIEWEILKIDAIGRKGAVKLPDEECAGNGFTSLFDVRQRGPRFARERRNAAADHPELVKALGEKLEMMAAKRGEAEHFDLTPDQEQRLKSLGYLGGETSESVPPPAQ
jgi:arylsulfatase A-like enzyme